MSSAAPRTAGRCRQQFLLLVLIFLPLLSWSTASSIAAGAGTCKTAVGPQSCELTPSADTKGREAEDGGEEEASSLLAGRRARILREAAASSTGLRTEGTSKGQVEKRVSGFQDDLYAKNYLGQDGMWCVGINAVGFDLAAAAGRDGDYSIPAKEQLQYFHDQGANCFRLPITWGRLQSGLGPDVLDLVDGVVEIVDFITDDLGDFVIIDPHNNDQGLQYNGVNAKRGEFVNLWKAIAKQWGDNPKAIFGLYNEPRYGFENGVDGYFNPDDTDYSGVMIEYWRQWMQEAINAIRALGKQNLILVPGLHWTTSRDWSGAGWWGESLEGIPRAGNTRLAALTDSANNIAYDVHQYMDPKFTGEAYGCDGHWKSYWGGDGADWGLELTIQWAKRFNKKLMMTEIGSWPTGDGSETQCKNMMYQYLQEMASSGVFIGYQVWQFGCPACRADQWTLRPYNLDWYRWSDFGRGSGSPTPPPSGDCSPQGENCQETKCCQQDGNLCFEKDQWWAECKFECQPGIHAEDPPEYQTPWTCAVLSPTPTPTPRPTPVPTLRPTPTPTPMPVTTAVPVPETGTTTTTPNLSNCAAEGDDCRSSRCCQDPSMECYEKDQYWAGCKSSCTPGIDPNDPPEYQSPWTCNVLDRLNCAAVGDDCRSSKCCQDPSMQCYEKDQFWGGCKSSCTPGIDPDDPPEYQSPWTCKILQ